MLRLAVTTAAETFDRMRDPLAARDIDVEHLAATEQKAGGSRAVGPRTDAASLRPRTVGRD